MSSLYHRGRPSTSTPKTAATKRRRANILSHYAQKRIWLSGKVHRTWKLFKSYGIFNSDSDFAAHLLALDLQRRQRLEKMGNQTVKHIQGAVHSPQKRRKLAYSPQDVSFHSESEINITKSWMEDLDCTVNLDGSVIVPHDETFQSDDSLGYDAKGSLSDMEDNRENYMEEDLESGEMAGISREIQMKGMLTLLDNSSASSDEQSDSDLSSCEETEDRNEDVEDLDLDSTNGLAPPTCAPELPAELTDKRNSELEVTPATSLDQLRRFARQDETNEFLEELSLVRMAKVLATEAKLIDLFQGRKCLEPDCLGLMVSSKSNTTGATLEIWWTCEKGHKGKWTSSEEYNGMYVNNFQLLTAILLSGNNFGKIELMSNFLGLGCPSASSFLRIQRFYCIPEIEEWWQWMRQSIISLICNKEVVVAGDGQNDSPGHSAKFLTYYVLLAEHLEDAIIQIECVDKREVDGKSPNMEREALRRAINNLKAVINLKEVTTDASTSIIKMMRDEFQDIVHSLDVWHKAKNIRKCLSQVAKLRGNEKIGLWSEHIINHLWFCCQNCEESVETLKSMWISVLYHVTNQHEWIEGKCSHGPIEDHNLPWFDRRDKDYQVLRDIILNPKLLASLQYYVKFRHTGTLEAVNSHSLMYTSKRFAFGGPAFKARKTLAAIDHNYHLDRQLQKNDKGEVRVSRKYIARTKHWDSRVLKEHKDYAYIPQMIARIFRARKNDEINMQGYIEMVESDPRNIAPTIAAVPAPPSRVLHQNRKSRFSS